MPKTAVEYSVDMGQRYYYPQINDIGGICLKNAKEKGFKIGRDADLDRYLLLIVSEICEAQEDLRAGHDIHATWLDANGKPCGFPIEIADAAIRLFHLAADLNIDLATMINAKLHYNMTRPPKHGKQF